MRHPVLCVSAASIGLAFASTASCGITTFFDDKALWSSFAGPWTKLDFVGSYNGQVLPSDWFAEYGITLASKYHPDAASWSLEQDPATLDGWQVDVATSSSTDTLAINFVMQQHAFAYEEWAWWNDPVGVSFFLNGTLVASSFQSPPFYPGSGVHFYGWVTDFAFDRVVLNDPDPVDNMYVVPGPGVMSLLSLVCLSGCGERRRRLLR